MPAVNHPKGGGGTEFCLGPKFETATDVGQRGCSDTSSLTLLCLKE